VSVSAQEGAIKEASKNFDEYAYADARDLYLRVAERGFTSPEVLQKLGDAYYLTGDYKEAAAWYEKLLGGDGPEGEVSADYYFRYSQSLKSMNRYDLADAQMEKFIMLKGNDTRGEMFSKERDYLKEIAAQSGRYSVGNVNFNSVLQDFGPSFYGSGIVFSSNREDSTGDYLHDWNDQPFLDLFVVENPRDTSPVVARFSNEMNTPYHESTSVFTQNGDVVYFTRNNYTKKQRLKRDGAGVTKLKLFRSVSSSDGWSTPEELPFNSDAYSTAHPALSPDGSTLYFASDRPGTKGLSDLWMVDIHVDGSFSDPVNLGDTINTEGRETFPFVSSDNKLFYASDGHLGLGGLDMFVTQLSDAGLSGDSYNVGKPVNSGADDFGLILNESEGFGYFSSSRGAGLGNDDIYSFTRNQKLLTKCAQNITGVTRDVKTDEILPQATVELRNIANEVVATQTSDSAGRFSFPDVVCSTSYIVRGSKNSYEPAEAVLNTSSEVGAVINRDLYLKPPVRLEVGDDLGKTLELNPIYFDFNKDNIRTDAAYELEKVIAVMKQYPNLKVDVRSHTDSRASDAYNMNLSQRRNLSTIRYIVSQGSISNTRLTGRGYGESQLFNACGNGIECSEEEHQLNRRSEFIIVSK
jgi:outer membrane protein OmpA-like peptidoglycan-associated protein